MLNKELYAKEIVELAIASKDFAVTSEGICACDSIDCDKCAFHDYRNCKIKCCEEAKIEWANRGVLVKPALTEIQKLYDNLSYTMKGSILTIMKEAQLPKKEEEKKR